MFERMIKPTADRVKLAIGRAVLRAINDAGGLQRVQIEALQGELFWADRVQEYGFYGHPPAGADVGFGAVASDRTKALVFGIDHRPSRPKNLNPGEVMVKDILGKFIHFKDDGTMHIKAPKIVIEGGESVEVRAVDTKIYASHRHRLDVGGYAFDTVAEGGGSFQMVNWTIGAVISTVNNPISPPEVA
ncbi:MAG: phage baseplate assembly protein [Rhodocyclaceae bacterium]